LHNTLQGGGNADWNCTVSIWEWVRIIATGMADHAANDQLRALVAKGASPLQCSSAQR
jgi:hypothetical protein